MDRGLVLGAVALLATLGAGCGDNLDPRDGECTPLPSRVAAPTDDLVDRLRALPGVWAVEKETSYHPYRYFEVTVDQPVDHTQPCRQRFQQHLTLIHRSDEAPMVLMSTGYWNYVLDRPFELTRVMAANQIVLEHRYFAESRPAKADWRYLDIRQAADDHHRIIELLRPLYPGPWLTTGGSKGGMTSLFHARFYPDDVDGTVPYVAPINLGAPDTRYDAHLDTLGTAACRRAVHDLQVEMMVSRRAMLEARTAAQAKAEGYRYTRIAIGPAVESAIAGLEWSFWQYRGGRVCAAIPPVGASDDALWRFLDDTSPPSGDSDEYVASFEAYRYQTAAQLGFPGVTDEHLDGLYRYGGDAYAAAWPRGASRPTYDPEAMPDILDWVQRDGERILLLYGQWDPWTAGKVDLGAARDSLSLTAPEGSHLIGLSDLSEDDRAAAFTRLELWTGVKPDPSQLPSTTRARVVPGERLPPSLLRAWKLDALR